MSVNNVGDSLGPSSRGYLKKAEGRLYIGSVRLLSFIAVYFYFLISASGQLVDEVKYYDVRGGTTKEFAHNWLRIQSNLGFAGYCLWQPKMNHSHTYTSFGYRASNLNLKVYVTLTLPRVWFPEDMPSMTRDAYARQVREIWKHEYAHRHFKIQFYDDFMKDFNRLPSYRSTQELYSQTNKLLWKHYKQTKAKDAKWDISGHK